MRNMIDRQLRQQLQHLNRVGGMQLNIVTHVLFLVTLQMNILNILSVYEMGLICQKLSSKKGYQVVKMSFIETNYNNNWKLVILMNYNIIYNCETFTHENTFTFIGCWMFTSWYIYLRVNHINISSFASLLTMTSCSSYYLIVFFSNIYNNQMDLT